MTRTFPSAPNPAPDPGSLPHALTFFLTSAERAAVLRALRAHRPARAGREGQPWRSAALIRALGIRPHRKEHRQ